MQRRYLSLTRRRSPPAMTLALTGCGSGTGQRGRHPEAGRGGLRRQRGQQLPEVLGRARPAPSRRRTPASRSTSSVYSWNDVDKKVEEMVKAGKAPDIAQIGAYADYAAKGQLYSADELLSIPTQADFTPSARRGRRGTSASSTACPSSPAPGCSSTTRSSSPRPASPPRRRPGRTSPTTPQLLKARGVKIPFALPLGPEEAQAETMSGCSAAAAATPTPSATTRIDSAAERQDLQLAARTNLVGKGLTGPSRPAKLNRAGRLRTPSPTARSACSTATPR